MYTRRHYASCFVLVTIAIGTMTETGHAQALSSGLALNATADFSLAVAAPLPKRPMLGVPLDTTVAEAAVFPIATPQAVLIVGGLIGGTAGYLFGAYAGDKLSGCIPGCTEKSYLGASVGMTMLVPLGVHLSAGGDGSVRPGYLAAMAVSLVGHAVLQQNIKPDLVHVLVPVTQVTAVIAARRLWP